MANNINIIQINKMINSSIQQGGGDLDKVVLNNEQLNELNMFLESIDDSVDLLKIRKALIDGKANAKNLIQIYHKVLIQELNALKLDSFVGVRNTTSTPWGDEICNSVGKMTPTRDKLLELYFAIYEINHNVIEIPTLLNELLQLNFQDCDALETPDLAANLIYDNYRIILNEIFTHLCAFLLQEEKYQELAELVKNVYQIQCVKHKQSAKPIIQFFSLSFASFNEHPAIIDDKIRREVNALYSPSQRLYKNFLLERVFAKKIVLRNLQQADTLLFYLSLIYKDKNDPKFWVPNYYDGNIQTLEIMLRSASITYFEKIKLIFNVNSVSELNKHLISFKEHIQQYQWLVSNGFVHTSLYDTFNYHSLISQK